MTGGDVDQAAPHLPPDDSSADYRVPVEIERWSVVAESDAFAMAGPGSTVVRDGDVAYGLGSDVVVIVVNGGDRPDGTGVRTAEGMTILGPVPSVVEVRLTGTRRPVLWAFVRLAEGCLALGTVRVSQLGYVHGRLDVRLYLDAPLPYDLLDRLRPTGPAPEQPSLDWLGLLPADPLAALERFVAGWYADVPPVGNGTAPPGIVLPEPLSVFHRAAAGRCEVYGASTRIYTVPRETGDRPEAMVAIGQESDGVFRLLVDPTQTDPTVYYDGLGDSLLAEREPLSGFLLLSTLGRAAMDGQLGGMAFADPEQTQRVVAALRPVPLRPLSWPCQQTRFYAGPGIVVQVGDDDEDWFEVYVGARHRALLLPLRELGLDWEHFTG